MSERLSYSRRHSNERVRKLSQVESDFELICNFLEFGKLRWSARISSKAALSQALKNVIDNKNVAFRNLYWTQQERWKYSSVSPLNSKHQLYVICVKLFFTSTLKN